MNSSNSTQPSSPNPSPEPTTKPASASSFRRHSKIARLPVELRERLNLMLHDGAAYGTIIETFAALGHPLNSANLSHWHAGGFKDWLQEQAWLEEIRARLDFAAAVVKEPNAHLLDQASLRVAVTRMYTLLATFDPATLRVKLAENPGAYVRVLNALCHLTQTAVKLQRAAQAQKTAKILSPLPVP
jgi:hypothetical protein